MGKSNPARDSLPPIPPKRYFAIGEVAKLCRLQPHVLRYWESEFPQLRPIKRTGNRRYYREHEILLIRRIRELLYDNGFTIQGARQVLRRKGELPELPELEGAIEAVAEVQNIPVSVVAVPVEVAAPAPVVEQTPSAMPTAWRQELSEILKLLVPR
jgi:DNA-binding transcriptional MerR regulator